MLGRLLIVGVRGAVPGEAQLETDLEACRQAGVGGVLLFDVDVPALHLHNTIGAPRNILSPPQLRALIGYIRERLGPETWICVDQEGGQVARLSSRRGFAADPSATEFAQMGKDARRRAAQRQATQLGDLGFDMNFAPCVDLALEADNPIIAGCHRAFSDSPEQVVAAASIILEAHAAAGVATCLKHFPGHGSSVADTHLGAVDVTHTWQAQELEPYRQLSGRNGVAVMVAHVMHRGLDPHWPASLSERIIHGMLRADLGFDGVVITDSVDMAAIADRWSPAQAAVHAVAAGADLVIDGFNRTERPEHPAGMMVAALQEAIADGRIAGGTARIEASLARIHRLRAQLSGVA